MKLVLLTILIASQEKYNGMKWSDWHLTIVYQIPDLLKVRMEMSKDMDGKVKCGGGSGN
jgi:hypothetical protein